MRFEYPVKLTPAGKFAKDDSGFIVSCRDLPEVITQGEDREDALREASDAMDEAFYARIKGGLDFPATSKARRGEFLVSPPVETTAKAALYVAMRTAGLNKIQLAAKLGVDEKEVRRLLDPHHASRLERVANAVQTLGGRLHIDVEYGYVNMAEIGKIKEAIAKHKKPAKMAKGSRAPQSSKLVHTTRSGELIVHGARRGGGIARRKRAGE